MKIERFATCFPGHALQMYELQLNFGLMLYDTHLRPNPKIQNSMSRRMLPDASNGSKTSGLGKTSALFAIALDDGVSASIILELGSLPVISNDRGASWEQITIPDNIP